MDRVGLILYAALCVGCGRLQFERVGGSADDAGTDAAMPGNRIAYVKASNTDAGDQFGHAIALSGDGLTLAVGAPLEASAATGIGGDQADNAAPEAGAVYVYRRIGDTWTQEAYVKPAILDAVDQFGWSVALSTDGNTLAVGARREDSAGVGPGADPLNNGATSSGAAYVFTRTGATWSQQAYLKASNTDPGDAFGERIALSGDGDTLAVSAPYEDSPTRLINGTQATNTAPDAGAVYVFVRAATAWTQQAYVKAENADALDEFGYKLALSATGDVLVVGAYREDSAATGVNGDPADNALSNSGAAYVFTRAGATWTPRAYLKPAVSDAGDNFGYSLGLSGDGTVIAVGAEGEASAAQGIDGDATDDSAVSSGALHVFTGGGAAWSQQAYVKASNTGSGDLLGFCAALAPSGDVLVGGAIEEASAATGLGGDQADEAAPRSGAGYVFANAGGWSQRTYAKATNTGAGDALGWSCAVAADAFALGAPLEDGSATGVDGASDDAAPDSGAVYVYY